LKDEYEIKCETRFGNITIPKMRSIGEGAELIYKEIRAEAITEFAEKLKEAVKYIPWCDYPPVHNCIDQIVENLKGEENGESDL
jgi:hypothetical protein